MKKTIAIVVAAIFMSGASAYAQGTLNFNNRLNAATAALVSSSTGTLLLGTGFSAQLFAGSDLASMAPVGAVVPFRPLTQATAAGSWAGITVTVPTVAPGQSAFLQVYAWDNAGGTYTSFAQAVAGNTAERGWSTVFSSAPLGGQPAGGGLPILDPNIVGNATAANNMTAFSLNPVPEPSVLALAGLGGLALLIRRRK